MSSNTSNNDQRLQKIVSACERVRTGTKHPRYAGAIKQQAAELVRSGFPVARLAQATGVTQGAIRHWTEVNRHRNGTVRILPVEKREPADAAKRAPTLSIRAGSVEITVFALGDHP